MVNGTVSAAISFDGLGALPYQQIKVPGGAEF